MPSRGQTCVFFIHVNSGRAEQLSWRGRRRPHSPRMPHAWLRRRAVLPAGAEGTLDLAARRQRCDVKTSNIQRTQV